MLTKFCVESQDQGSRLDTFLLQKMSNVTRSHIKKLIEEGKVTVEGKVVKAGTIIKEKQEIFVELEQPKPLGVEPENIALDIVYQDEDLAVINKPQGLVVHPANGNESGTLVNALLFHLKDLSGINGVIRPGIVHRLDKNTSGLLIIAKNDQAHISLAKQIETKTCHRYYQAICVGNIKQDTGIIKTGFGRSQKDRKQMAVYPLGEGKVAETHYKVLERFGNYTLVEFVLMTGRTHQIRVHAKHIGHPILNDDVYGKSSKVFKSLGQYLHAYKIEFDQPTTGKRICIEVPPAEYFQNALKKLRNGVKYED